jgi:carboxymethylenebutenolidase
MCSPRDAVPPLPAAAGQVHPGESITLTAADGADLLAWRAESADSSGAGVVILPDIRGLFGFYQRLAEQFAALGIDAVAIDYFGRTAGTGPRGDDFDHMAHVRQTTDDGVYADIAAGVEHLRSRNRVRSIFTVGFCFGGTYSLLQVPRGQELGLAGAIGFYAGMKSRSDGAPTPITAAPHATVPVLGLFGGADKGIPVEQVEEFAAALATSGVDHSVHVYPGAPHSFFDRAFSDYSNECADAWRQMREFISTHAKSGS